MVVLRLALGFLVVTLGLAHLFYPTLILRMNAFMRENLFRDSHVLLNNRKIGSILVIIGFLWMIITLKVLR